MGSPNEMDMGGLTLVVNGLRVGATGPGQTGTEVTGTELAKLDGVTATTAQLNAAASTPTSGSTDVDADDLVIPVTHQYVAKTSGGDAEACTLADGTAGQFLTVELAVDGGGDATVTPATATGFVAVVLADAGDVVTLRFVDETVGWILIGAFGATAQPAITQS
jgi:hypothetical protein